MADNLQAVAQVWLVGRRLIGPVLRQRLLDGGVVRFEENRHVREAHEPADRTFAFELRPHGGPGFLALYGRLEPDPEWHWVDGPWPTGTALLLERRSS